MSDILCCRYIIILWNLNLIKTSLTEFGIQTFLTSSPMLIVNAVFVGRDCVFGCEVVGV